MRHYSMLTIRSFIQGKDEEIWLKIFNAAYKEYDDFRPSTMEDMEKAEKSPNFDPTEGLLRNGMASLWDV
jgi:hypothetical protein